MATNAQAEYVRSLVARIARECPRRKPTSDDERRASQIMAEELGAAGLEVALEPFEFNNSLYANLAVHFGLGTLGTAVSGLAPAAGLALHLGAGWSYLADSTRRGYLLRRCFDFAPSQNVIGVLPARGIPKLRVVILAHVDAACTGLVFHPAVVERFSGKQLGGRLAFLNRVLATATYCQFGLAACDAARLLLGPLALPLRPLEYLLSLPGFLVFLEGLEISLRDRVVAGANDDLSGAAALPVLARRLARGKPPAVELVFAATGCEEASLGGADALIRSRLGSWSQEDTVAVALDCLGNGDLRYLDPEGEVVRTPLQPWLAEALAKVAGSDRRFAGVTAFEPVVGGSDAAAFQAHGFPAVGLTCIDPALGAPRHYHQPSDTPENLDLDQVMLSVDFAEALVREVIRCRLGGRRRSRAVASR